MRRAWPLPALAAAACGGSHPAGPVTLSTHEGLVYGHAGHSLGVGVPYLPAATHEAVRGGSPRADAAVEADLWPRVLKLLPALRHR